MTFFTVILLVKCHQGRETGLRGVICCPEVGITELLRVAEVSGRIASPTSHVHFVQFAFTSPKVASLMFPPVSTERLGNLWERGWRVLGYGEGL